MAQVNCRKCDKGFYVKPSHQAKGFGKYCSCACAQVSAHKGKMMACSICGKESYKQQKAIKRSKSQKFFCSKRCQTLCGEIFKEQYDLYKQSFSEELIPDFLKVAPVRKGE